MTDRLREARDFYDRDYEDSPHLDALVDAASLLLNAQPINWCTTHDLPEATEEGLGVCALYWVAAIWPPEQPCHIVSKLLCDPLR